MADRLSDQEMVAMFDRFKHLPPGELHAALRPWGFDAIDAICARRRMRGAVTPDFTPFELPEEMLDPFGELELERFSRKLTDHN